MNTPPILPPSESLIRLSEVSSGALMPGGIGRFVIGVIAGIAGPLAMPIEAAPVLYYDFNTPGALQSSIGASNLGLTTLVGGVAADKVSATYIGPDGTTVLGLAGSGQNTVLEGSVVGNTYLTSDLGSFTIAVWVQNFTHSSTGNERLFYLRGGSGVAIDFSVGTLPSNPNSQVLLAVNGGTVVSSSTGGTGTAFQLMNGSLEWQFLAVTYNSVDGSIIFYSGIPGQSLVSYTSNTKVTLAPITNSTMLHVANIQGPSGGRLMDANIDDLAFYNTALDAAEISTIFQAIPEPSGVVAVGGGLALVVMAFSARRRAV